MCAAAHEGRAYTAKHVLGAINYPAPDGQHSFVVNRSSFANQLGPHPCSQGGVCSATQANKYSQDRLRLMKGQDIKYLTLKSQAEAKVIHALMLISPDPRCYALARMLQLYCATGRCTCIKQLSLAQKLERLQKSLHFIGVPQQSKHTVYLEPDTASEFSPQQHFDTPKELLSRAYNRPRNAQLEGSMLASSSSANAEVPESRKLDRCAPLLCSDCWLAMHEAVLRLLILSMRYTF